MIKLSKWATQYGISYKTAWRWFNKGNLPSHVTATQLDSGAIFINDNIEIKNKNNTCGLIKDLIYSCDNEKDHNI